MLKDAFKDYFYIGTTLNSDQIYARDHSSLHILKKHFNSITAENDMKWSNIQERQGEFDFDAADRFVALGEENNTFIVGHALIWHNQTPDWVFQDESGKLRNRETVLEYMRNHILTVVDRYKGRVHGWDVVNEALDENGQLRKSRWLKIIGEDYIQKAFEYAHEADPHAELYYNDYSLVNPLKRDGVVRIIRNLQSKNIKVHGIGMQGHWSLDYPHTLEDIEASVLAFSKLGVDVMITELDVSVLPPPDDQRGADVSRSYEFKSEYNPYPHELPQPIQEKLADRYSEFFKIFYKHRDKISRVTIWGIHDGQSWLNDWPIKGRTNYPLLFDREYKKKPAFYAVAKCVS
jgi:endo-1,4-beta-xylanase